MRTKNTRYLRAAFALGQALVIGLLIVSCYKAATGRPPPETFEDEGDEGDYSQEFRFGFLRGGIFHGWPSGHTVSAFAMVFTMLALYPNDERLRKGGILYACYIGLGVSSNIHWLSDALAAPLLGMVIGTVVGKHFGSVHIPRDAMPA